MRYVGIAALCLLPACDSGPDGSHETLPVRGGMATADYPAVVAVGNRRTMCGEALTALCTGTLIAPRVVLTAAHCFDRRNALEVAFGPDTSDPTETRVVQEVSIHPDFDDATNANDLALLLLDRAATATPVPLPTASLDASAVGKAVRVVGFGYDGDVPLSSGTKREGTATISAVDGGSFRITPNPGMSCVGDSGGPVFLVEGQTETLVGVTSSGDLACAQYGDNMNLRDYIDGFVQPFLDDADNAPGPHPDGPVGAEAICTTACMVDTDCPSRFECNIDFEGVGRCSLTGTPTGDWGAGCQTDDECSDEATCTYTASGDACACLTPCVTPPPPDECPDDGCSSRNGGGGVACALALLTLIRVRRRRGRPRHS